MVVDKSESPRRKFVDVSEDELMKAVIEMCVKLGISNSVAGLYSISGVIFAEHAKARQMVKDTKTNL